MEHVLQAAAVVFVAQSIYLEILQKHTSMRIIIIKI